MCQPSLPPVDCHNEVTFEPLYVRKPHRSNNFKEGSLNIFSGLDLPLFHINAPSSTICINSKDVALNITTTSHYQPATMIKVCFMSLLLYCVGVGISKSSKFSTFTAYPFNLCFTLLKAITSCLDDATYCSWHLYHNNKFFEDITISKQQNHSWLVGMDRVGNNHSWPASVNISFLLFLFFFFFFFFLKRKLFFLKSRFHTKRRMGCRVVWKSTHYSYWNVIKGNFLW